MNLGSDTPVVGAPVFDALLDLLAGEVVFESLFGEIDDLVVRGKAKADQLILSEAIDLSVPRGGGEGLQAQPFFEADDAVLDLERIRAELRDGDDDHKGQDEEPSGGYIPMVPEMKSGEDQVGKHDEE